MSFDTFTRIIDQFANLPQLHLQGLGEPLLHPRFFDMVEYAGARGIRVTTNSNLTLLTARRAQSCVVSGLDSLSISIDGATAETYEHIRVGARFDGVLRNLNRLLDARSGLGSQTPHLRLVVVAMRQNLNELPDLVRLAHRWSMEEVFVQHLCHEFAESTLPKRYYPMRQFIRQQTLLGADPARTEGLFRETQDVAEKLGIPLRLPRSRPRLHPPGTAGPDRCDWPWKGAYVSYQGYAMPCCMVGTPDRINFGSVAEQGMDGIWTGKDYEALRRRLDSDEPPEICRSCSVYWHTF